LIYTHVGADHVQAYIVYRVAELRREKGRYIVIGHKSFHTLTFIQPLYTIYMINTRNSKMGKNEAKKNEAKIGRN
jgi:hypothetical protein